jgi:hypothetical protein
LGGFEIYKDALRTFEILTGMPLARRGRMAVRLPAKFWRGKKTGMGGGVVSEHQDVEAHLLEVLGRGGDDRKELSHGGRGGGGGALIGEEVPGEEEGKLGLNSCRKMWGNYWSSRIGRRRGGDKSSTAAEAYRRKGERR